MLEQTLDIAGKDGAMETFICRPERGTHPAVALLMDAPGIREELRDMARRLASVGYCVLLPNLYYRAGRDTIYGPEVLEHGSAEHQRMRAVRTKMTIPPVMDDVAAMLAFIDAQATAQTRAGRRPWLLHERALRARRRRALSRSRRALRPRSTAHGWSATRWRARIVARQGQGRALHRLRRDRRVGTACDGWPNCARCLSRPAVPARLEIYPGRASRLRLSPSARLYDKAAAERHWGAIDRPLSASAWLRSHERNRPQLPPMKS